MMERPPDLDLGLDHRLWWFSWAPDRALNPQYAELPDVERFGAIIETPGPCWSSVHFRGPVQQALAARGVWPEHPSWEVVSWEPLTLAPSLLCRLCGDHGFIRDGRWVPA